MFKNLNLKHSFSCEAGSSFARQISNFKFQIVLAPTAIILFAVVLRLVPHPPNVAPIGAMALFGGVYLDRKYALLVPLVAMFISDIFLGFHNTMLFVYGSFLLTGLIGLWIRKHKSIKTIVIASLSSSILFFLITNVGVWIMGNMYPKTADGLAQAFYFALPFFRNTLLGDLFYTALFFGGYEIVLRSMQRKLYRTHLQERTSK